MARRPNLIFLLADGAHARFVERTEAGAFSTFKEMDGGQALRERRELLRHNPPGRAIESVGGARHAVGPEDLDVRVKEAFAAAAAKEALVQVKARKAEGLVLVAPARLLPTLQREASGAPVGASLAKDLAKTEDVELGRWLAPLEADATWSLASEHAI